MRCGISCQIGCAPAAARAAALTLCAALAGRSCRSLHFAATHLRIPLPLPPAVEPLPSGGYRVGVHIADVSHFVQAGSALDKEAQQRSTSGKP